MIENGEIIKQNIALVREKVARAAEKSGRKPEDIATIAVTKTVDVARILAAIGEDVLELGENRVQELCEKYDEINEKACPKSINWHLIGHLQTNKVKYIIDKVKLIHSVDSLELASEIHKRSLKAGRVTDILAQINVAGEESKFGIKPEAVPDFIRALSEYDGIRVKGLMTVAPIAENPEDVREVFRKLRKIFIDIKQENIDNIDMTFLSMGMSNDFEVAIEEGANMVRIGSAIFGRRNYQL